MKVSAILTLSFGAVLLLSGQVGVSLPMFAALLAGMFFVLILPFRIKVLLEDAEDMYLAARQQRRKRDLQRREGGAE